MPLFSYRAVNASGETVNGEMDAADRKSLVKQLRDQGFMPLHTEARASGSGAAARKQSGNRRLRKGRMDGATQTLFIRQLATLLGAGLPLDRALATVAQQAETRAQEALARDLLERVRGGTSLAESLEAQGGIFPSYVTGLVRAGEAGGTLHSVLAELAETMARAQAMQQEIRAALNYPILVLVAAAVSIVVLLAGVIPEFEPLFADAGSALPLSAQVVLALSRGFQAYWWGLPMVALAVFVLIRWMRGSPAMRAWLDGVLLRLPLIGKTLRGAETSRFCRTLGTLLANGVDVVPALKMGVETIGNARLRHALAPVAARLKRGDGLAEPLAATEAMPALAIQLMRVGEGSGQLDKMLTTVADIQDEEVRRDTRKLLSLLVPVVTLVLGVIVAMIIGAILSAILSAYDLPM